MSGASCARVSPCASCPFRTGVPSGVWDATEYAKLPEYDGEMAEQSPRAFMCHQGDGDVCSGWLAHRGEPGDLLAVRLGVISGALDPSVVDYSTTVDLFPSGAAAAAHGLAHITDPDERATAAIGKIIRKRAS